MMDKSLPKPEQNSSPKVSLFRPGIKIKRKYFSNFAFKAKGGKHRVLKQKEAVQIDPEVVASIEEFVTLFVTEARLEQGLAEVGADIKKTGNFIKWFSQDVYKESVVELEASELEWSQVVKGIETAARNWYIAKCKNG